MWFQHKDNFTTFKSLEPVNDMNVFRFRILFFMNVQKSVIAKTRKKGWAWGVRKGEGRVGEREMSIKLKFV